MKEVLWVIAGMIFLYITFSIAFNIFRLRESNAEIRGEKSYIIDIIVEEAKRCLDKRGSLRTSFICKNIRFYSDSDILSGDVLNSAIKKGLDTSRISVEDIGRSGEIIIRYENGKIYIERVKHERVGS